MIRENQIGFFFCLFFVFYPRKSVLGLFLLLIKARVNRRGKRVLDAVSKDE